MTHYKDKKEKAYFSRHAYLETDIDTALLDLKLHRQPCNFHTEDTIRLTHRQKHVIASMLYYAYRYAFPDVKFRKYTMYLAIFSMQLGLWLMHDDSGKKKAIVRLTERICLGYPLFSPLIPSDTLFFRTDPFNLRHALWKNPWDSSITSNESFFELYDKSKELYLSRIHSLYAALHAGADSARQDAAIQDFLQEYGNLSFHSGLSAQIPRTNKNTAQICAVFFISVFCFCILLLITDQQAVCKVSIPVFIYHFHQRSHGSVLQ